ncbi:flavodoxin family protein [Solimonas flava]|uniref:flavodoxin family protein n=1 Tax=Solimonas flava TaxID=415849 RepID=UPI0003F973F2|nr:flavodoxin [Solimonas flava]
MKDALVVYYSRSGSTRRLAQRLAERLDADLEEIREAHGRSGAFGFLRSLYDVMRAREPRIAAPRHDPREYKMVLVGSPVWASHVSSPVRSYLTQYAGSLRRLGFFCTLRGSGATETLAEMAALREPQAETIEHGRFPGLALTEAQLGKGAGSEALDAYVETVRQRMRAAGTPKRRGKSSAATSRSRASSRPSRTRTERDGAPAG